MLELITRDEHYERILSILSKSGCKTFWISVSSTQIVLHSTKHFGR